ncbi:hypothetical protein MGN70_000423 [Eutypa lata]|nr:hypothetical protein MGN70_000423 [Eutypa lata]
MASELRKVESSTEGGYGFNTHYAAQLAVSYPASARYIGGTAKPTWNYALNAPNAVAVPAQRVMIPIDLLPAIQHRNQGNVLWCSRLLVQAS